MPPDDLLLALLFLVAAVLYSSVGHAGASGYLAAMALVGAAAVTMRPTALVLNILVATVATVRFARAGHFSWRVFWPFAAASIPMSFVGGAIHLPPGVYRPAVGVVLALSGLRMILTARKAAAESPPPGPPPLGPSLAWGAVIGLAAGLTGTGGGIFLSPLLLFAGWAGTRTTAAVSAVFILVNSVAGLAVAPGSLREVPDHIVLWAGAALVGALIGTELGTRRLTPPGLRLLLGIVLLVAASKLVLS